MYYIFRKFGIKPGTVAISVKRRLRRIYLRPYVFFEHIKRKEDISVIIVVRNRSDERIINSLRSIRAQTYFQDLIEIVIVDYDSNHNLIEKYKGICKRFRAEYIRVENKPLWCKSHGLNIAIKRADTKYILSSDVDIIFKENYIEEAIKELRRNPFQIVLSEMLDLPQVVVDELDFRKLRSLAKQRFNEPGYVIAVPLTMTFFFKKIRGYDEKYKLWGKEDDDLIKRFNMLGLDKKILDETFHLHQWHPKHEGINDSDYTKHLAMNTIYFENEKSLVRNNKIWGDADKIE